MKQQYTLQDLIKKRDELQASGCDLDCKLVKAIDKAFEHKLLMATKKLAENERFLADLAQKPLK